MQCRFTLFILYESYKSIAIENYILWQHIEHNQSHYFSVNLKLIQGNAVWLTNQVVTQLNSLELYLSNVFFSNSESLMFSLWRSLLGCSVNSFSSNSRNNQIVAQPRLVTVLHTHWIWSRPPREVWQGQQWCIPLFDLGLYSLWTHMPLLSPIAVCGP